MTVVFEAVDKTEVFVNKGGGLTILQTDVYGETSSVVVPMALAPELASAILAVCRDEGAGESDA